eukprot:g82009.t1
MLMNGSIFRPYTFPILSFFCVYEFLQMQLLLPVYYRRVVLPASATKHQPKCPLLSCVLLHGLSFCRSRPAFVVPWMSPPFLRREHPDCAHPRSQSPYLRRQQPSNPPTCPPAFFVCSTCNYSQLVQLPFLMVFPRCLDVSCLLTPSATVCQASTSTYINQSVIFSGRCIMDYAVSFASCFFPAFLLCFVFLSSSALLVRSDIYATEPRSIAPQRCGCVPTLVFCMGSMSPTLFLYVSFSLVFRMAPSAFLSCRVLKQDYPTSSPATKQPTNMSPCFFVRSTYLPFFLPLQASTSTNTNNQSAISGFFFGKITLPASPATKQPTNMSPYVYFFVCSTASSFVLPLHTRIFRFLSTDPFCYGVPSFNINEHQKYPVCYVSFSGGCIMDYAISRVAARWTTLFRLRAVSSLLSFLLCFPLQFRFS